MAYSKAKLKNNGNEAYLCFKSFQIGNVSHKCLSIWTLLQDLFKYILISLVGIELSPLQVVPKGEGITTI
jgi:hypothetical protein